MRENVEFMIRKIFAVIALWNCVAFGALGGEPEELLNGVLIFCLTSAESDSLASAISDVTSGDIYHVGIVSRNPDGGITVVEATTPQGVCERPLAEFLADCHHGKHGEPLVAVGRLKDRGDAEAHVARARKYLGRPYDYQYLEGDSAIYCSELVHYAYVDSLGEPIFEQEPMSFHDSTGRITDFWIEWYGKWDMAVPEGAPGTNPQGISRSEKIYILTPPF